MKRYISSRLMMLAYLVVLPGVLPSLSEAATHGTPALHQPTILAASQASALFPQPIGRQLQIPDPFIDLDIDPRLPALERAFMHRTMLRIPPSYRRNVVYLTADGNLHSNRLELLGQFTVDRSNKGSAVPRPSRAAMQPRVAATLAPCSAPIIGGEKTGEFRRVVVSCTGYPSQIISFSNPICDIGNYASTDLAYILGGAYTTNGSSGVDTGLQYSVAKSRYNAFLAGSLGGIVVGSGNLPCGGSYSMATTIMQDTLSQNTFVLNDSYVDQSGGNPQSVTLMGDVSSTIFALDGSNWVARRCTCLAQKAFNAKDGSWFGFSPNNAGGPDLTKPEMEYTSFIVSNASNPNGIQVTPTIATSDRNPPNENESVLCGHDPYWHMINYNTYEGFNLGNANASGAYNEELCYDEPSK